MLLGWLNNLSIPYTHPHHYEMMLQLFDLITQEKRNGKNPHGIWKKLRAHVNKNINIEKAWLGIERNK